MKDPDLMDKLSLEADGIFLFALEGLKRVINNHYHFSETIRNKLELQLYREESDSVLSFIKECCETGDEYETGSTELYNSYKGYCEEGGLKAYSPKIIYRTADCQHPRSRARNRCSWKRRTVKKVRLGDVLG